MTALTGMSGSNPRDFLAAIGLLRISAPPHRLARLRFSDDGAFVPEIDGVDATGLVDIVVRDANSQAGPQPWRLEYEKIEKRGTKCVADLKAPPEAFRNYIRSCLEGWVAGQPEGVAFAAGYGTDIAVDGKGNTKPTAFHFTAANQQFLDTIEKIRGSIDRSWCEEALFRPNADRSGPNLRWDPAAERAYALMAADPNDQGTMVNAPLEWLAFRALPLVPVVPRGTRAETTGVRGRGEEMRFRWPLWGQAASLATVASLIRLDWWGKRIERPVAGIFAICTAEIRRAGQGFGNFGPAQVVPAPRLDAN